MPTEFPLWLVDVAERVAVLVKTPGNRRVFEARAVKAIKQLRERTRIIDRSDDEWTPVLDLKLRGLSLDEKFAWLAAIHDRVLPRRKPIVPRGIDGVRFAKLVASPAARAKYVALLPMLVLRSHVGELRTRHRKCVEAALAAVVAELSGKPSETPRPAVAAKAAADPTADPKKTAKGRRKPGRKKMKQPVITERQKEILRTFSDCGRNASDAARVLGVTHQYVSKTVMKAQKKLATAGRMGTSVRVQMSVRDDLLGERHVKHRA